MEKRKGERWECDIPANILHPYRFNEGDIDRSRVNKLLNGRIKNISKRGILLELSGEKNGIKEGDGLDIEVYPGNENKISFVAVVRHVSNSMVGGQIVCYPDVINSELFDLLLSIYKGSLMS